MRILAIDPGFGRCGVAIVDGDGSNAHVTYSGCVETKANSDFIDRLLIVANEVTRLINEFSPETVALEELYFSNNQKTAFHVAEIRGMLMYIAASNSIPLVEFNPLTIKIATAGHGRATKNEVVKMVERLTNLSVKLKHDDEYDAIALGITALAHTRNRATRSRIS